MKRPKPKHGARKDADRGFRKFLGLAYELAELSAAIHDATGDIPNDMEDGVLEMQMESHLFAAETDLWNIIRRLATIPYDI
jgi:hypothetical protein